MKNLLFLGAVLAAFHISHSTPDFCQWGSDSGRGTNFAFAVFYDHNTDQCNPFFYQGEGGNGNRFANETACMRTCSPNVENTYPVEASKICFLKHTVGECSGSFLRYYYDAAHGKCKKFLWTGCHGNGNRFFDADSCNNTCFEFHSNFESDKEEAEEDEPDTPIAIICGVLLAIIVVAVLITVTVLTVQSKKKKRSKKAPIGKANDPQMESPLQESGIEMA